MRWFSRRSGDSAVVTEPASASILPSPMESIPYSPLQKNYRAEGQHRDAFIVELIRRRSVLTSDRTGDQEGGCATVSYYDHLSRWTATIAEEALSPALSRRESINSCPAPEWPATPVWA